VQQRAKSSYIFRLAVAQMWRWSAGRLFFGTITFQENILEKAEAMRRFRSLKDRLRRSGKRFSFAGVWQRQKRGAWHFHFFTTDFLNVEWFRPMAVASGFGPQMFFERIGNSSFQRPWLVDVAKSIRYVCRYMERDCNTGDYENETLVSYGGGTRCGNTRFYWNTLIRKLHRLGCDEWMYMNTGEPVYAQSFDILVNVGFGSLSDEEKAACFQDQTFYQWFFGPPGLNNPLQPF